MSFTQTDEIAAALKSKKTWSTQNTIIDPYRLQKIALLPARKTLRQEDLVRKLSRLRGGEQEQLLEMVVEQNLQFFWLDAIKLIQEHQFYLLSQQKLKNACLQSTTRYLTQKKIIMEIDFLLSQTDLVYALFKGGQIREAVYDNPAYRPSIDIDLLVSPEEKDHVLDVLIKAGFTLHFDPANVSHEVNMVKDGVFIDLHWDIMRPGRTRVNLVQEFLESRQRQDFFWGLDTEAVLFIMLVHPVFTKYSTAPQSAIVRLVDICRWLACREIDWERLIELVERSGMKTASWITLSVLKKLTGEKFPQQFYESVVPGFPKKQLLGFWLNRNLSSRFVDFPFLSKYIFTLLAHDCSRDVVRFFLLAARAHNEKKMTAAALQKMTGDN